MHEPAPNSIFGVHINEEHGASINQYQHLNFWQWFRFAWSYYIANGYIGGRAAIEIVKGNTVADDFHLDDHQPLASLETYGNAGVRSAVTKHVSVKATEDGMQHIAFAREDRTLLHWLGIMHEPTHNEDLGARLRALLFLAGELGINNPANIRLFIETAAASYVPQDSQGFFQAYLSSIYPFEHKAPEKEAEKAATQDVPTNVFRQIEFERKGNADNNTAARYVNWIREFCSAKASANSLIFSDEQQNILATLLEYLAVQQLNALNTAINFGSVQQDTSVRYLWNLIRQLGGNENDQKNEINNIITELHAGIRDHSRLASLRDTQNTTICELTRETLLGITQTQCQLYEIAMAAHPKLTAQQIEENTLQGRETLSQKISTIKKSKEKKLVIIGIAQNVFVLIDSRGDDIEVYSIGEEITGAEYLKKIKGITNLAYAKNEFIAHLHHLSIKNTSRKLAKLRQEQIYEDYKFVRTCWEWFWTIIIGNIVGLGNTIVYTALSYNGGQNIVKAMFSVILVVGILLKLAILAGILSNPWTIGIAAIILFTAYTPFVSYYFGTRQVQQELPLAIRQQNANPLLPQSKWGYIWPAIFAIGGNALISWGFFLFLTKTLGIAAVAALGITCPFALITIISTYCIILVLAKAAPKYWQALTKKWQKAKQDGRKTAFILSAIGAFAICIGVLIAVSFGADFSSAHEMLIQKLHAGNSEAYAIASVVGLLSLLFNFLYSFKTGTKITEGLYDSTWKKLALIGAALLLIAGFITLTVLFSAAVPYVIATLVLWKLTTSLLSYLYNNLVPSSWQNWLANSRLNIWLNDHSGIKTTISVVITLALVTTAVFFPMVAAGLLVTVAGLAVLALLCWGAKKIIQRCKNSSKSASTESTKVEDVPISRASSSTTSACAAPSITATISTSSPPPRRTGFFSRPAAHSAYRPEAPSVQREEVIPMDSLQLAPVSA